MADLGYKPNPADLILSKGADFIHTITPDSGSYPAGMEAWIVLLPQSGETPVATWDAICTSTEITWTIQADGVGGVDAAFTANTKRFRLYVRFDTTPTTEYLWYFGKVKWQQ